MAQKNGYFQLDIREASIKFIYFPPVNGGEPLKMDEVIEYLNDRHIENFNLKLINETILTAKEPVSITICNETTHALDEIM